ncbi:MULTISPECIES: hypothetical protein [Henriciella]|jgi:hypothetical protein|uniref:hypothetical protein n=1 Tax=Henriciella TaxID=453849 RepID=UPI0035123D96
MKMRKLNADGLTTAAVVGGLAILASSFAPNPWNLVGLLPLYVGGCLIFYLLKFGDLNDNTRLAVIGIALLLGVREYGAINGKLEVKRLLATIDRECSRQEMAHYPACQEILGRIAEYQDPELYDY